MIIEGFYKRTHFIKNPYLLLKCNTIYIVSKTNIVKYFNIEIDRETVSGLESHSFHSLKKFYWRNTDLVFDSVYKKDRRKN